MNNFDLRQAIAMRVHAMSGEQLFEVIEDSVGNDEKTLPGLGVLFEMIWQESSAEAQHQMVECLHRRLASMPLPSQPK
ncbi:small acid-soluble spore protein SspI [Paenibacillus cisolokensis]|uniref:Small, acid-soluble spore protein I n=1 Tax=Paenibacillus cisolokensis TaxID=1658519 RepID=A0ABQ4N5K7_9BACL|nr:MULTISPECIES: small acid-soluble spore protein SspI [Paenibacillus]ALS29567.1 small acid-soluble spore protein I [Paenibacillus sp. 32O-W]GIQ63437.1 small, acid-soluble spore protein I [Paenibacillus cisolokensis]